MVFRYFGCVLKSKDKLVVKVVAFNYAITQAFAIAIISEL